MMLPRERTGRGGNVLVLGGGGARGLAHFGVLKVLERTGVRIDRIVGVSIGAFVGALYAQDPDAEANRQRVQDYIESERFRRYYRIMTRASKDSAKGRTENGDSDDEADSKDSSGFLASVKRYMKATIAFHRFVMKQAVLTNEPMEECLKTVAKPGLIEDLKIPLTIVAVDLRTGNRIRIEDGDLYSAVVGSTALPGIFPPVERDGKLLADYGVLCSVPVSTALRYDPAHVIAVDLTPELPYMENFSSGLEIVNRMEEIGCFLFKEHIASAADVIIKPDVNHVDWADFADMDTIVERGIDAAEEVMPTLLRIRNNGIEGSDASST